MHGRANGPPPSDEPSPPSIAKWASRLGRPSAEPPRSRHLAHVGGVAAITALVAYLTWRVAFTLPVGGWNRSVAWMLVTFEALPLSGLVLKAVTLWDIDSHGPDPVESLRVDQRVVVMIPTFNEPLEVIAPTVAAGCALQPSHETWVLDDGDRPWVADMCEAYGARYICRPVHDHAKAGNMNYALDVMEAEDQAGIGGADFIAVLDCDHVPLPTFLTATLGWFDDERVALVQGPQAFYNHGAFDDDGVTGEQGLFFNVLMPARHHAGAGPFWCGSTSLLRVSALRDVGGVATETITEDMHTTLKLIRAGWRTVYHNQTLAVGLAPATPDQYMVQRRRWGMGAMQILVHERLWSAKRWMSWRNFHEYLNGTLWWLEGIATLIAFIVPIGVLASGAETSTASPLAFATAFAAMFSIRLWGAKRLMRKQIHWPTAFALRIFRIPVGMACLWWLMTRKTLEFEVTPKGAQGERRRGRTPRVLLVLAAAVTMVLGYAIAGTLGLVPWRTGTGSTVASGVWLGLAGFVLLCGALRIRSANFATSRRNAHRIAFRTSIEIDDVVGELLDVSVGGAAVRFPMGALPQSGLVEVRLPGAVPFKMEMVVSSVLDDGHMVASLRALPTDWVAFRTMSLWMFHTPADAVRELPAGVPVVATLT
jgi:cellulose synthase (UDP-forming)